ncbi:hypothetical protein BI335_17760 [Enemella evansiae]|nr:hypothetical protein BI335_17760 [Enemella evansiae]
MMQDRRTAIRVGGAVLGLAVLAAGGVGVARALTRPADPNASLRTAVVSRGTVQQVLPLTGSVRRVDQVRASFPVAGTISGVNVAVGDQVRQGDVLATMDPLPLQTALLDARAQLAQAQAQLDSDQNPTAPPRLPGPGAGAVRPGAPGVPGVPDGAGIPGGAGVPQVPVPSDLPRPTPPESVTRLPAAMTAVHEALAAQQDACRPILTAVTDGWPEPVERPPASPNRTWSPTPSRPAGPSASPTASASPTTRSASPTPSASPAPSASPTPAPTADPTPSTSAAAPREQRLTNPPPIPPGLDPAQFTACSDALQRLVASQQQAATLITEAAAALNAPAVNAGVPQPPAQQRPVPQPPAGVPAGVPSTALPTATPTVDQAKVATDRAAVLAAEQAIAQARSNLDAATLRAPIAGTVGTIGFTAGAAATPNAAITVVGGGAAEVTVPVPLTNRPQVQLGQEVRVNAPGSLTADPGTITEISPLPVSATASTPSYNVTVLVADPGPGLASGGRADTGIVVGRVADAVTVPVSAVTRVATGTGTVRVLDGTGVRDATVATGLVGGGLVEITGGLTAGQRVVLADGAQPLPTTQLRNLRGGQSGSGQNGSGQQTPSAQPS